LSSTKLTLHAPEVHRLIQSLKIIYTAIRS
jgi:hypothetical protein